MKLTQISDSQNNIGYIFPDSQYVNDYVNTESIHKTVLLNDNDHIPTSKMVKENCVSKTGDTLEEISGPKVFTGTVGNSQSQPGIYFGLDENEQPNANISIISNNTAAYIDFSRPNVDYDFRIIKWIGLNNSLAQLCYSGNVGNYILNIPAKNGTLATTSDINPGTVTSVRVQATSPVQSSSSGAEQTSLNTTISLADGYGDTKNPYTAKAANYILAGPISGDASTPSFRALDASDIPNLNASKIIGGGTISYNGSDTALYLKGNSTSSYIGFRDSSNTAIGYFGVNASKKPVFYDTTDHQLAYNSDVNNSTITLQSSSTSDSFTLNQDSSHIINLKTINNQPIVGLGNLTVGGEGILGGMSLTFNRKATSTVTVNTTNFEYGNYLIIPSGLATMLIERNTSNNLYVSEWIQASYSLIDSTSFVIYQGGNAKYISKLSSCYIFKINFPS